MLQRSSTAAIQSPKCSLWIRTSVIQSYRPTFSSSHVTSYKRIGLAWEESPLKSTLQLTLLVHLHYWSVSGTSTVFFFFLPFFCYCFYCMFGGHEVTCGAQTSPSLMEGKTYSHTELMVRAENMMSLWWLCQLINSSDEPTVPAL